MSVQVDFERPGTRYAPPATRDASTRAPMPNMQWIPGTTFRMGSDRHYREEAPVREVSVEGFWIDRFPVTNAQFARFVHATGYRTLAERIPDAAIYPGALEHMLVPGSIVFEPPERGRVDLRDSLSWWRYVPQANWKHPTGPDSTIRKLGAHPVVHIAYEDAEAYATWIGKELPTEAEWELAARGGLDGKEFSWGDERDPGGRYMANYWQGVFPLENLKADGYERTSPVGVYPSNGYGLYDMIGNVWEWTADWWRRPVDATAKSCCASSAAKSGAEGSLDSRTPDVRIPRKVLKGGSYLCAQNYCYRYRPAARIPQQIDTSTCHQGFRCVLRPRVAF